MHNLCDKYDALHFQIVFHGDHFILGMVTETNKQTNLSLF